MYFETIDINNQSIALHQKGSGDTTLFFIHGNSSSVELFHKQFNSDLIDKFHLVAIDLPGHGNSDNSSSSENSYTMPGYGKIISAVADYLHLRNVIYVGHSLGGHIILESWNKFPFVKGLVVFGSTPFGDPPIFDKAFLPHPALASIFSPDLTEEMIELWAKAFLASGSIIPGFIQRNIRNTDPIARKIVGESIPKGLVCDEFKLAEKLKVPLAIFHGTKDQIVNSEYLENLSVAMTWKNKIHYIPDAGHSPQWENSDKFNALLEEYAAEVLNY